MGTNAVHTRVPTKTTLYFTTNVVTMNVSHPVEHQVKCADVYFIEIMYEESGRQGGFQEKQADYCNPNMQKC